MVIIKKAMVRDTAMVMDAAMVMAMVTATERGKLLAMTQMTTMTTMKMMKTIISNWQLYLFCYC